MKIEKSKQNVGRCGGNVDDIKRELLMCSVGEHPEPSCPSGYDPVSRTISLRGDSVTVLPPVFTGWSHHIIDMMNTLLHYAAIQSLFFLQWSSSRNCFSRSCYLQETVQSSRCVPTDVSLFIKWILSAIIPVDRVKRRAENPAQAAADWFTLHEWSIGPPIITSVKDLMSLNEAVVLCMCHGSMEQNPLPSLQKKSSWFHRIQPQHTSLEKPLAALISF